MPPYGYTKLAARAVCFATSIDLLNLLDLLVLLVTVTAAAMVSVVIDTVASK